MRTLSVCGLRSRSLRYTVRYTKERRYNSIFPLHFLFQMFPWKKKCNMFPLRLRVTINTSITWKILPSTCNPCGYLTVSLLCFSVMALFQWWSSGNHHPLIRSLCDLSYIFYQYYYFYYYIKWFLGSESKSSGIPFWIQSVLKPWSVYFHRCNTSCVIARYYCM